MEWIQNGMPRHAMACRGMLWHAKACHGTACHAMPCHATPRQATSRHVMSRHVHPIHPIHPTQPIHPIHPIQETLGLRPSVPLRGWRIASGRDSLKTKNTFLKALCSALSVPLWGWRCPAVCRCFSQKLALSLSIRQRRVGTGLMPLLENIMLCI